jgi:hypothetical protein
LIKRPEGSHIIVMHPRLKLMQYSRHRRLEVPIHIKTHNILQRLEDHSPLHAPFRDERFDDKGDDPWSPTCGGSEPVRSPEFRTNPFAVVRCPTRDQYKGFTGLKPLLDVEVELSARWNIPIDENLVSCPGQDIAEAGSEVGIRGVMAVTDEYT